MGIREDIRDHFDDSAFLDLNYRYGSNHVNGRSMHQMLANDRYHFRRSDERIHYDRGTQTLHLHFGRGTPINYRWSLVAHECIHAYVQHRGYQLGLLDDEVVAHLGQVLYYRNATRSYDFSFMGRFQPIFAAAERVIRRRRLQSGMGETVTADDVVDLKRQLRTIAHY